MGENERSRRGEFAWVASVRFTVSEQVDEAFVDLLMNFLRERSPGVSSKAKSLVVHFGVRGTNNLDVNTEVDQVLKALDAEFGPALGEFVAANVRNRKALDELIEDVAHVGDPPADAGIFPAVANTQTQTAWKEANSDRECDHPWHESSLGFVCPRCGRGWKQPSAAPEAARRRML